MLNLTVPEIHAELTIAALEPPIRLNAKTSGRDDGAGCFIHIDFIRIIR